MTPKSFGNLMKQTKYQTTCLVSFKLIVLTLMASMCPLSVATEIRAGTPSIGRIVASTPLKSLNITIATKGDELAFDKTSISAKPGQPIKLTFINKASKSSGLLHNWVLVNPGTTDSVGQASMAVGQEKGYIAASPDILAHTKLLNTGEKDTIEFKAPEKPGDYPFICTFPGHYTMMKGVLKIK